MAKKLEIYGTLGPSCIDRDVLLSMFRSGMTGIRLNLSHKSLPEFEDWLQVFYEISDQYHMIPDILVDLQGPELRIGIIDPIMELKECDLVTFQHKDYTLQDTTTEHGISNTNTDLPSIPVPSEVLPHLKKDQIVRLDDGKIEIVIEEESSRMGRVLKGGILRSKKSIALDGLSIDMPTLTEEDLKNIRMFRQYRITGVMLPFVRNREDLIALKMTLMEHNLHNIRIFAKIENMDGVRKLPELLPHCDQIVIARGDLGNAVPLPQLPGVQKEIAMVCRQTKTPFMVVTQMLASMEQSPVPTRAEVSDIFNAVLDGASAIMLTGETAAGLYPAEAMQVMCDTAYEAQAYMRKPGFQYII